MADLANIEVPTIGVVCGGDDASNIVWDHDVRTASSGNNDSVRLLRLLEPAINVSRMHLAPSYFRQTRRHRFRDCQLIWNAISNEVQNPKTLAIAQKVIAETRLPVVNPPALIPRTSRVEVSKRLAGIDGVRAPKVLLLRKPTIERVGRMVRDSDFTFPAILRQTHTHNGQVLGIFDNLASLEAIYGDRNNEYYLIEYVDVRPRDGFFRKTRFFFVGDQVMTRQHIVADEWSVHGRSSRRIMADHPELVEEARDVLVNGFASLPTATRAAVHSIREKIGLDYLGLDCCLMEDGGVVVFECNATMNFNPNFRNPVTQYNRASLPRLLAAFRRLIEVKTGSRIGDYPVPRIPLPPAAGD